MERQHLTLSMAPMLLRIKPVYEPYRLNSIEQGSDEYADEDEQEE